jgi:hypothetical protein
MRFSERLKKARRVGGLTQQRAADRIPHLPVTLIQTWERGIEEPAPWIQYLVTEALGLPYEGPSKRRRR